MMEQLSGVMIIIIIGGGVLISMVLFLFAKRQIMRFTLRSRRGPHVPVGNDANKNMRREIERRLDCIKRIAYEPKLIWDDDKYILQPDEEPLPSHYYRMKAVDDVKILEKEISRNDGSVRHPHDSLRAYLLATLASPLGSGQKMIHQFTDMYEHARHDPNEFGCEEYEAYQRLLLKLIDAAKTLKLFSNSRKTSPSRTPLKKQQTKMHSLDPSRLRPPPISTGIGTITTSSIEDDTTVADIGYNITNKSKTNLSLNIKKSDDEIVNNNENDDTVTPLQDVTIEDVADDEDEILSISQYSGERIEFYN